MFSSIRSYSIEKLFPPEHELTWRERDDTIRTLEQRLQDIIAAADSPVENKKNLWDLAVLLGRMKDIRTILPLCALLEQFNELARQTPQTQDRKTQKYIEYMIQRGCALVKTVILGADNMTVGNEQIWGDPKETEAR